MARAGPLPLLLALASRMQPSRGAALLEAWLSQNDVSDAELGRGRKVGASGPKRGQQLCLTVKSYQRADPAQPFAVLVPLDDSDGDGSGQPDLGFHLRVTGRLPEKLPARFCGVYTGRLSMQRW